MWTAGGEKPLVIQFQILNATLRTFQAGYIPWEDSRMKVMGTTNYLSLDLKPVVLEGIHVWYCKPSQKPMARKVVGHKDPSTVVLLNGHTIKMLSKYLALFP